MYARMMIIFNLKGSEMLNPNWRCGHTEFNCPAKNVTAAFGNECKECSTAGYTYENHVLMGAYTDRTHNDKTWAECAAECDKNSNCYSFAYQTQTRTCYLKRKHAETDVTYLHKENFVFSRRCGTTEFNCPNRECNTCQATGFTNELEYYSGAS